MTEVIRGITDTGLGVFCWEGIVAPESAQSHVGGQQAAAEGAFRRGGMLSVETSPNEGTAVTVQFHGDPADCPLVPEPRLNRLETRILIAHGDGEVAASMRDRLTAAGLETDCVRDGAAVIDTVADAVDRYDVVLADLNLPRISRQELARLLSKVDPTVHLLFVGEPAAAYSAGLAPRFEVVEADTPIPELVQLISRLQGTAPEPAGPVILIADDDPLVRGFITDAVSPLGGEVLEAADGAEALELLQARPVDLLIVDLFMPEIEGLETIRSIRRNSESPRILAISGGPDLFLKAARVFGADVVMQKPITPAGLRASIAEILGAGRTLANEQVYSPALR